MKLAITMAAALMAAGTAGAQDAPDARKAILDKFTNQKVTLDFTATPLSDVLNYLRDASGLNFHLDSSVTAELPPEKLAVTLKVRDLPMKSAMKIICGERNLTINLRDGILVVLPKGKDAGRVTRIYDVRDLMLAVRDFPGPKMELNDKASGILPFPVIGESAEPPISEDFLQELIRTTVGGTSWDEGASLSMASGLMVVSQTPALHRDVASLLNRLRQIK